jgi:hypothetical protein
LNILVVAEGFIAEEKLERAKELIEKKREQKEQDEEQVRTSMLHPHD